MEALVRDKGADEGGTARCGRGGS
ncbi:hypothetical protein HaLaN_26338, partial [Haematococcus lacustris]